MDSIKSQLLDMGFSESKVKRAISSCPEAQTLEQVMEWLIAHEDEQNSDPSNPCASVCNKSDNSAQVKQENPIETKCNQISAQPTHADGQVGETAAEEAARKKITVEEAQKLIIERQAKRAEEERKKAIEDEKKRREMGQKILETRQELQDQERIRLAQQIRQEKLEMEAHRKRVLEQIALDREAMKNRVLSSTNASSKSTSSSTAAPVVPIVPANECKLALRFSDGSSKVHKFSPKEPLSAVRLFVQLEKSYAQTGNIEFVAPPNRKLTDSDMNETLENLGLCPASRLEVKYALSPFVDLD